MAEAGAGWIERPVNDDDWQGFVQRFGAGHRSPLSQLVAVVREAGCSSVVIENRYVDADYRSEFALFWAQRFADTPAFARRLHFFQAEIADEDLHRITEAHGYLGYAVLRPFRLGPLGRVVVRPPDGLQPAVKTSIEDSVSLFGADLQVTGAPFYQQDGEFLRCAHVAAWICHYAAFRRGIVARSLSGTFVQMAPKALAVERSLPSKGMNQNQLQSVFGELGQPALFYGLSHMPDVPGVEVPIPKLDAEDKELAPGYWDTRIFSVICRYLNSGFPVLITTRNHAFTLVGWFRDDSGPGIRFVACDDQKGPYEVIASPFSDERAPWQAIMIPLPPKVYLSGEMAETVAHRRFREFGGMDGAPEEWSALAGGLKDKSTVSLRTILVDVRRYKAGLERQGRPDALVRVLRLAQFPQWIWVVEAQDREARKARQPCVIAEVVFDSTSSDIAPRKGAIVMPGAVRTIPPDDGPSSVTEFEAGPWRSLLRPE